nr:RecName: Full=Toxin To46; AltName: Full=Toxin Tc46 [Tityus obscurus]
KEGYLFGSRG